jgi:hypothetical protein
MSNELNLYGIYLPALLLLCVVALVATQLLGRLLARYGVYRWVWHPALFDVAVFVIILGALDFSFNIFLPN